ncbi:MAPEG family protein [Dokdonella sp.]|uniref:MAPEG family protein n=1 Tax=Dokdonella sp. TaxID=2291710 RepID=UPI003527929C
MATSDPLIFLPLLVQVLLTVIVYVGLAVAKARALKHGQVDPVRRALHADAWPESVQKINNNIRNQFEVPVLFYALVLMLYELGETGVLTQGLAWLFVASRIVHAYVHTGANIVRIRRPVFMLGCIVVLAMLVLAAVAVLNG